VLRPLWERKRHREVARAHATWRQRRSAWGGRHPGGFRVSAEHGEGVSACQPSETAAFIAIMVHHCRRPTAPLPLRPYKRAPRHPLLQLLLHHHLHRHRASLFLLCHSSGNLDRRRRRRSSSDQLELAAMAPWTEPTDFPVQN
jgi:hypothetical protein